MQFPRTEAEIAKLGEIVVQGLEQATEDFPAPPVPPADLRIKLEAVHAATAAAVAAESAFREHHAVKDEALEDLADSLKANLKYAEFAVREHPEKLNQLGWGGRRDSQPLSPPGEVRDITVGAEGGTSAPGSIPGARYRSREWWTHDATDWRSHASSQSF